MLELSHVVSKCSIPFSAMFVTYMYLVHGRVIAAPQLPVQLPC